MWRVRDKVREGVSKRNKYNKWERGNIGMILYIKIERKTANERWCYRARTVWEWNVTIKVNNRL